MRLQAPETGGSPSKFQLAEQALREQSLNIEDVKQPLGKVSPAFPFELPRNVSQINGTSYLTAQTLVQQVAYTLSDKLFSYSSETFELDCAAKSWSSSGQTNGIGAVTSVNSMETRLGAANILLGYVFSPDSDPAKQAVTKSIIASSASLLYMRSALDQLALLYSSSSPFVAHVAAVDFDVNSSKIVTDYVSAITVAQETGIGLVTSFSAHEAQHMALFATIAATVLPTVHIYDGVQVSRESTKVTDVLDQSGLQNVFSSILEEQKGISKKADRATRVNGILESLNAELGTTYSMYEYKGHDEPEAVLVVFGSVESSLATQVAAALSRTGEKVGVIAVRVYRPFSESYFLKALPKSVRTIAVLGQVSDQIAVEDSTVQSTLYVDVVVATSLSDTWGPVGLSTFDVKYPRDTTWSPKKFAWIFDQLVRGQGRILEGTHTFEASTIASFDLTAEEESTKQYIFWDIDDASTAPTASVMARLLSEDVEKTISFSATYDNIPLAGILQTEIKSSKRTIETSFHAENADVTVVNNIDLLSKFDPISRLKHGGNLILKSTIKNEDLEKKLPVSFRRSIIQKGINITILDTSAVGEISAAVENVLVQLAFLRIANLPISLDKLSAYNLDSEAVHLAVGKLDGALRKVEVPKEWAEAVDESQVISLPSIPQINSFTINEEKHVAESHYILKSNQFIAQSLSFKEAYGIQSALRPDLGMRNYIVKVKENKRLTPDYYDRNIFHIEFDLTGTGMEYEIGEALGIHAHNDPEDVAEFIKFYGINGDDVVEVPSRDDPEILEIRTVFQALSQNVDIFGRPPKRFYETLAEFADNIEEKKALLTLSSVEGATEFKRRAEVDTCTFADILQEYPSAHPEFHDLVKIISPMKRREYSIASSQKVHPDSVHLLIVVVNWVDPKGRDRFGQATKFLSMLQIGVEVTVSVKPSVMKLPPLSSAPLIMAGLGTGLAPFRAFVQYRAWQKAQGMEIGSVLLYMGSRHQREEYLYGEEWEAYQAAGIVTLLGRAFSRDQPEKIYIQDRMRQSLDDIIKAYIKEDGGFYLCGPTWPVPDVTEVLQEAIVEDGRRQGRKVDGAKKIEELKDGGRYVLEVY